LTSVWKITATEGILSGDRADKTNTAFDYSENNLSTSKTLPSYSIPRKNSKCMEKISKNFILSKAKILILYFTLKESISSGGFLSLTERQLSFT
jgi:hypothetical protein